MSPRLNSGPKIYGACRSKESAGESMSELLSHLNPAFVSVVTTIAIFVVTYKVTKPSGCVMHGAVLGGALIASLVGSTVFDGLLQRLIFRAPPDYGSPPIKRLFRDSVEKSEISSLYQFRFLALTQGEIYSVLRFDECAASYPDNIVDFRECPEQTYKIVRQRLSDLSNCREDIQRGPFSDVLEYASEAKYVRSRTNVRKPLSHLGEPARQTENLFYYDLCVEIVEVSEIPSDTYRSALTETKEYAFGYRRAVGASVFQKYQKSIAGPNLGSSDEVFVHSYCYRRSLNHWELFSAWLFSDPRREASFCRRSNISDYVQAYLT